MSERSRCFILSEPLEPRLLLAGEPWGAFPKLIKQDAAISHYPSINGSGQAIAIIDTGVDYKHPALGGGFGPGYKVIAGYDFVDNDPDPMDEDGHGTGLAGIIAAKDFVYAGNHYRGLAPNAKIIALRTSDSSSSASQEDLRIEQALQWVIAHRTQYNIVAINLSEGSGAFSSPTRTGPYWDELQTLSNLGVFIAASSGNSGVSSPPSIEYPAADPSAYAIGSINSSDVISTFTERSSDLDLLAPGENVPTTYWNPSTSKHIYLAATGTSFAAPFAAAAAALLKQADSSLSPSEIMDILSSTGSLNYDGDNERGAVTNLTFPRLNIDAAITEAMSNVDDAYEPNNSASSATRMTLSNGAAHLSGLRLLAGNPDYYSFTLSEASDLQITLGYTGGSSFPAATLLDSGQQAITSLPKGSKTISLDAGSYFIQLSSSQTLDGTYSINLSASSSSAPVMNGTYSDLAYDSSGRLHIAWYDSQTHTLKYVTRSASGMWSEVKIVDKTALAGQYVSLAIDHKGLPGLAYYDAKNQDLKYAHLSGGTFSVTRIDSKGSVGEYASLAYNSANKPAISYYSRTGGNLKLAVQVKSKWSLSTIDSIGDTGRFSSLALNPKTGGWGIAYLDNTNDIFRYAEKSSAGKWNLSTIEDSHKGGGFISLAFDNKGRAGMSYFLADTEDLRYAHFDGRKWTKQTVASKGSQGKYSTLLFDGATPSIFFQNQSSDTAMLATSRSGSWSLRTLATQGGAYLTATSGPPKSFLYRDTPSGTLRLGTA
jgi:hypothetical protein